MNVLAEPLWTQKRGSSPEEYEDAVCPMERREFSRDVRLAVADGATESVFARRWAEQLVHAISDGELSPRNLKGGIPKLRTDWREWLAGKPLPWYIEEKAQQGTFAAVVALELAGMECESGGERNWFAAAVGDSCLFQVRSENVLVRFPVAISESFDTRPFLLGSLDNDESKLNEAYLSGTWEPGDRFLLMTDALACWFLSCLEGGKKPSEILANTQMNDAGQFAAWIDSLRDQGTIRNDDCTMIRVSIQ